VHAVAVPAAAAGRLPHQPGEHARAVGDGAGRGLGQRTQHATALCGHARAVELGAQRRQHPVALAPLSDQPRLAGQREPGGGQLDPPVLGRQRGPGVEAGRRQQLGLEAGGGVEQPGGGGHLDQQRGGALVDVERLGRPAQVAHAQARRRADGGRLLRPRDEPATRRAPRPRRR
jgi:hypothetical protein